MNQSIKTIRKLAKIYLNYAMEPRNLTKLKLHRDVNDLRSTRPVVMINEVPWVEMNFNGELTLTCNDPVLRACEDYLRKKIFQYRYFPCDMVLQPYLPVKKIIVEGDFGIQLDEETIATEAGNHIVSHDYHDQLASKESVSKIYIPTIDYDKASTMARYQLLGSVLGDIIPVRLSGLDYYNVITWDDISRYRGVTPLLMDLIDRPEHTHNIMRKLTDISIHRLNRYEELGLFDNDPIDLHCTPVVNSTLSPETEEGNVTRKNIWGRGAAQILASVSGAMRDEFDIPYMQETIGQCGLAYYGCCEPLDKMIDVVEKIPNLRKISITPWADVDNAAEVIGSRYVLSSKPNPATLAVPELNVHDLKNELGKILNAGKKNKCHMDIVLKDISTTSHNPSNIIRWAETAMDMVENY